MANRDDTLPPTGDGNFPAGDGEETRSNEVFSGAAKKLGPYKLLHKLGEGGMGTVWMAEQQKPVRRRVALKLIKTGIDNKQVIARFEAERQVLAMMNHENIAKILDAGTTDTGQPYFVMELVQGVPFNKYCDKNNLSIKDRLELFIPVCKAVQHAHQKGIIHRDIKPSNVLVCLYDGVAVPKVIDFGLAKALEPSTHLTDKTMFTEFGQVVGTLQYMSPEQTEMNQLDINTRTDIYSMGVMLYELLTGSTPIDQESLKGAAILNVLKIIRETEPPRPSDRLSSSTNKAVSGISSQRQIEPSKLKNILRGELDWVVMMALEKDRGRRYQNASALADDLTRYLNNEMVNARPPSLVYRTTKFVKKNRIALMTTTSILVVALIAGSAWRYSVLIERERNERFTAQQNTKTQVNSLEATRGIAIPFVLEDLDELPRALVLEELQDRFSEAKGRQKVNLAYGLAHLDQFEVDAIVGVVLDAQTQSEEFQNIVIALSGNPKQAIGHLKTAAEDATARQNWKIKVRIAAVALYLGELSIAEEMLASTKPDPVQRTFFISEFPKWVSKVELLPEKMAGTDNPHLRSGICLSLGGMERLDQAAKDAWRRKLEDWYLKAPDGGTHSAARWAMNQLELELPPIEETKTPTGDRNWWHTTELRFVKIPSGSVQGVERPIVASDDYWLSDCEVTTSLFQNFIDEKNYNGSKPGPEKWRGAIVFANEKSPELPVQQVTWFEAVMFCNWLSWKLGLEACYEIEKLENEKDHRFKLVSTNGIRLPTVAEWEFACRAETTTRFSIGDQRSWLDEYGWFDGNSDGRTHRVAAKRCNAWGMFDMHGNVFEWCWGDEGRNRVIRGGDFFQNGRYCQSSADMFRFAGYYGSRDSAALVGFRVARGPLSASRAPSPRRGESRPPIIMGD